MSVRHSHRPSRSPSSRSLPPNDNPADDFGSPEINHDSPRQLDVSNGPPDLDDAIAKCSSSTGLFAKSTRISSVLTDCYALARRLAVEGEEACKQALDDIYFELDRGRLPLGKPYLIAVQLGAKPKLTGEHKTCSDYATVLERAHDSAVEPDAFSDWFATVTLAQCLKAIRAKRKAAKARPLHIEIAKPDGDVADTVKPPNTAEHEPSLIQGFGDRLPQFIFIALNSALDAVEGQSDDAKLAAIEEAVKNLRKVGQAQQEASHA